MEKKLNHFFALTIFSTILIACSNSPEKPSCSDFKTGTFEYYEDSIRIEVVRNEDFQIEKTPFGDSKYKVEWLSDCEYTATLSETDFQALESKIGTVYELGITSSTEDSYTYQIKVQGTEFMYFGEMKRVAGQ